MTTAAMKLSQSAYEGFGRRFVVCLVALAFMLQSYVTQSHLHDSSQKFGVSTVLEGGVKAPAHGKLPIDDSPLNCSICQAIAHAGAVLAPATLPLIPTLSSELAASFAALRLTATATIHSWQSRAPPPQQ